MSDLLNSLLETSITTDTPPGDANHDGDADPVNKDDLLGKDTDGIDLAGGNLEEDAANLECYAHAMEQLSEQLNVVRLNRQTKLLSLTNRSALLLARRSNDPLFDKYAKFNKLRLTIRAAIVKKYGTKAAAYARKLLTKVGTGDDSAKK